MAESNKKNQLTEFGTAVKHPLVWLALLAFTALTVLYFNKFPEGLPATQDKWGQFSDYVGGLLNPLISLFTLTVALAVWKLQKEEVADTRIALQEQAKTLEQQRAEQRFFDMLKLYQSALDGIENTKSQEAGYMQQQLLTKKGVAAIRMMFAGHAENDSALWSNLQDFIQDEFSMRGEKKLELAKKSWWLIAFQFDHYFRICYRILLEAEDLLKGEDDRYIKLFRAQLSQEELQLLAFNLVFSTESQKMRSLVERYGLLKHLLNSPLRVLVETELNPRAFCKSEINNRINEA